LNDWITLAQAAKILDLKPDGTDAGGRIRLIDLLRRTPEVARIVTQARSRLTETEEHEARMRLPATCTWSNDDMIDWAKSTVLALPLLSRTHLRAAYPNGTVLQLCVSRAAVQQVAQTEREAEGRSRALKIAVAERLFAEPFWPAARVLSWIAFRDPRLIEASWRAAKMYIASAGQLKDPNPRDALLRAVQGGNLAAVKDGSEMPREAWANTNGRFWLEEVRFRREDVLGLWPDERRTQTRSWRTARIDRFRGRQRYDREWINFAEIADWCSRETGSITPDERKRAMTFELLEKDLLAGEFDEDGRSRVLYMHPFTTRARMTREWLAEVIQHNYDGSGRRSEFLRWCWLSRKAFDRWVAKYRLPAAPDRFRPQKRPSPEPGTAADENAAIGALAAHLKRNPELSRSDARAWCRAEGLRFSDRGFQSRVWPEARKRAGLARKASPGRKRKSSR
jgi:hypothetical protein